VDFLQQGEIDLVLMDIQMPVMGGMEATQIIRQDISASLPVIALTANAIKGDNEKCIEGGMNAYLSKPFKEKDLLNIVAFWVNKGVRM
jgi:CheY-like chemotaxis protein